ncbi:CBL-interacting protein kinase 29 [Zea mays]|uniref:non-specific serine/threonine protein kinase n=2 Tax=Zea mays TaxID=4577 RepID=B6SPQ5_MAIZE|nr:CBL-interacting serine/threonine-protein kinase 11 [Zea mays]ACG26838.1 CBL-interacting serine/threonine-protein kinase 11 [Zea mays]ONM60647.1 CBL-interacting serine/threonine-protein kinase 11 [Zea mays]PWZ13909.1 CBL-interacting protein kinase 29 [Zea mays]|eukprot:NP_001147331.1 CBL-interacting serine/threonine-protein kinase 11 [Zea mays]
MPPATGAVADTAPAAGTVLLGRYELGGLLGRGASAKVYLARDLLTGRSVAIKSFPNPRAGGGAGVGVNAAIEREACILRRLRHRHVVRLHEILATRKKVHFVLDLAGGGELFSLVDASGRMTEDLARHYFRQLVSAVRYCHARGVYHRDIKPENLLLDEGGALKVADFGLGAVGGGGGGGGGEGLRHTMCGTPAYVAPEILSRKGYEPGKVDIWSCGVVLFVLAAGYLPFNDASLVNMYRKIYAGRFRCPGWFSPALRDLLRRVLDPDPSARIDADGIVAHPWFRHGGEEDLGGLVHGGYEEVEEEEEEAKADEDREPTAFDILSFSPGSDLSALFVGAGGGGKERVFVGEPAAAVLGRVEAAARKGGYRARRDGKRATVYVEEEEEEGGGGVLAKVSVFRLADAVSVVEVVKGDGADAALVWTELLEPAVKPPALS